MLDNGRLRLDTALKRWRQCRTGKHDWHKPGTCSSLSTVSSVTKGRRDNVQQPRRRRSPDRRREVGLDQCHLAVVGSGTIGAWPCPAPEEPAGGTLKSTPCGRAGSRYAVWFMRTGRQLPDAGRRAVPPAVGVDAGQSRRLAVTSESWNTATHAYHLSAHRSKAIWHEASS